MMQRHSFKMFLNPGQEAEYRRRHDEIWPELVQQLHDAKLSNYSIHLDPKTNILFGYLERADNHSMERLPLHPVMQRWWQHMKDVMQTNADGSPIVEPLTEVFYMP